MADADPQIQDAMDRIAGVEKRLAALQELGLDTAALRSQLAFAQTRLLEGAVVDADRVCEEVLATARRMAQGSGEAKVRTGRISRDELADAVREIMGKGLFAKLLAEQQGGADPRIEARLEAFDRNIRDYLHANQRKAEENLNQVRGELGRAIEMLRGEIALIRRVPNEPLQIVGLDHAVETMSGRHQEGAAALATAVEELGERLTERLAAAQTEQARQTEALVAAVRQQVDALRATPADQGPAITVLERIATGLERQPGGAEPPLAGDLGALVQALQQGNAVVADTVRDGLKELGAAIVAGQAGQGQDAVAAGLERIAVVLDRPVAGDADVAGALRDGLKELGATLAADRPAADAGGVVTGLERIAAALDRQVPVDGIAGSAPLADEIRALARTLGERLDHGETIASAVRDGLGAVGQALSAPRGDIEKVETRATLQAGFERIAQALEQRAGTAASFAPVVDELKALEDSFGGRSSAGEEAASALRDGFRELVAALATLKPGDPPPAIAWEGLVDRLVTALSTRSAAPDAPDAPDAPAQDAALATAVREGFANLAASLGECAMVTAPLPVPAEVVATLERIAQGVERRGAETAAAATPDGAGLRETLESMAQRLGGDAVALAVRDGLKELGQAWAARPGVAPTDVQEVAQALDAVCARLDTTRERLASSIETGLAKVAEALAARPVAAPAGAVASVEGDDLSALAPNGVRPVGHDSRSQTEFISEHDSTKFAHQVTTGRMAPGTSSGGASVTKVAVDRLRRMVMDETQRSLSGTLRGEFARLLPELLQDPAIVQQLCGIIALESVSHPGVLGELTGLRTFLRRELKIAVEALAKDLQPV